jgi:DNA-dependent RNA polymerase
VRFSGWVLALPKSKLRSPAEERFIARNRLKRRGRYAGNRLVFGTPLTREVSLKVFLGQMADFLAGKLDNKPPAPPGDLGGVTKQIDPETLALTILLPIFDAIGRGWKEGASEEAQAAIKLGRALHDQALLHKLAPPDAQKVRLGRRPLWRFMKQAPDGKVRLDWNDEELLRAGCWMLECASLVGYFGPDERGFPAIRPEWQEAVDKIADEMLRRSPMDLPLPSPAPDWASWRAADGATFVRDWQPETRVAIGGAFAGGKFEHAAGVNVLQHTGLKINLPILALVEEFGLVVKERKAKRSTWPDECRKEWSKADRTTLAHDLRHARHPGDKIFYLAYCCDTRGRLIPRQHLNYQREDHVRALFQFAGGEPIGTSVGILEIHAANCFGVKGTWDDRLAWAKREHGTIEKIAADPRVTLDDWIKADDPFQFVAACLELVVAWADPGFITHLPVGFDGSCSGIQHLCMLCRDERAGSLVNLIPSERPRDVYGVVAAHVQERLNAASGNHARWWRRAFRELKARGHNSGRDHIRKLLKGPTMTFPYSVSEFGMAEALAEVYAEQFAGIEPTLAASHYLAKMIMESCREVLARPASVMDYIRGATLALAAQGRILTWRSPTGFPVANQYYELKTRRISVPWGGRNAMFKIAEGRLGVNAEGAADAAAPNFIHSRDAAHLIRTILGAHAEEIDCLPVHDCFAALAPHATRFNKIIRREMAMLYARQDHLAALGNFGIELPAYGALDPLAVQDSEYAFS